MNTHEIECLICHRTINYNGMAAHVKRTHKLKSTKDYYDTYFIGPINKCLQCGNDTNFVSIAYGYRRFCCQNCARRHTIELTKQKYNVDNISQVPNISKKMKSSIKNNWESLSQDEYNERCKAISDGTSNAMTKVKNRWNNEVNEFCIKNNVVSLIDIVYEYGTGFLQTDLLNIPFKIFKHRRFIPKDYINIIKQYSNMNVRSKHETYLFNIVKLYYSDTVQSKKVLGSKELDIYVPSIKLGIEYNGNRFHCIESGKLKNYHLEKSLLCRKNNIRLIHIYEFEDFNEQLKLLISLLEGNDIYSSKDFNKNNLIKNIPKPEIIYSSSKYTIYGAGKLRKGN